MLFHAFDERREILCAAQLYSDHRGTAFTRILFGLLEMRDVVIGSKHMLEKFPQRACPLRKAQDKIML